jgi:type II secretion system protein N
MVAEPKNNKWLGYTLYVVLATVLMLYLLFPGQEVDEFLNNSLGSINPDYAFRADKIEAWIPVGTRISAGEIYLTGQDKPAVFKSDTLVVRSKILDLIKGERRFSVSGTAYSGDIEGTLHYTDNDKGLYAGGVSFRNIDLAEYEILAERFAHRLIGSLSGEIEYGKESTGAIGGSGKANLRLDNGQLQLKEPILDIDSVDLQSIRLEAKLSSRIITITKADLAGPEVKGSMTGSIQLQKNVGLSQLNMKGSLEPLAEFYKNHPELRELLKTMKKRVRRGQFFFTVTGTLANPTFKLL